MPSPRLLQLKEKAAASAKATAVKGTAAASAKATAAKRNGGIGKEEICYK